MQHVSLVGFGVRCLPRDQRFAGSNPLEVDIFGASELADELKTMWAVETFIGRRYF